MFRHGQHIARAGLERDRFVRHNLSTVPSSEHEYLMATPAVFDIVPLLATVSDAHPAGPELRSAPDKGDRESFYAVRDARKRAADAERRLREWALLTELERDAEPGPPPDPPDWDAVCSLALAALSRSKDLWITAWLIEGLTRLKGFAGLRDGFLLAYHFCKEFWSDVHPRELSDRFVQLAGLNGTDSDGTLVAAIMSVPITAPMSTRALSCADYKDAAELERKDPALRKRRAEQGAVTIETFGQIIANTKVAHLRSVLDDLQQAADAYASLNAVLIQNVSDKTLLPPSSRIRGALDECLRVCRTLTKDFLTVDTQYIKPDQAMSKAEGTTPAASAAPPQSSDAVATAVEGIRTREDALGTLMRAAEYFRQTEPHSPISYALEQAVRWARLSLPELLSELVSDKGAREEIFKRAGIAESKEDN